MALVDHGIIEDLKPLGGGWRYVQKFGDQLQYIPAAFDPKNKVGGAVKGKVLVQMVRDFRISNGIPMGDPEQDIADYIKIVSPPNDRFGRMPGIGMPRTHPIKPLAEDLREWIDATSPQRPRVMTSPEATERAEVCLKCPQNIKWRTGCGACNEEIVFRGAIMRNLATYPYDDTLKGCRLARIFLPAAVFLDRDFLPAKPEGAPEGCWLPTSTP